MLNSELFSGRGVAVELGSARHDLCQTHHRPAAHHPRSSHGHHYLVQRPPAATGRCSASPWLPRRTLGSAPQWKGTGISTKCLCLTASPYPSLSPSVPSEEGTSLVPPQGQHCRGRLWDPKPCVCIGLSLSVPPINRLRGGQ
jgi:hypothetical protein